MSTCELLPVHEQAIELHQDSADDLVFKLYDECSSPSQISATDHLVWIVRDESGAEVLRITSQSATPEGSLITIVDRGTSGSVPAEASLFIAQGDASYPDCGTWELRTLNSSGQEKVVAHGKVNLFP